MHTYTQAGTAFTADITPSCGNGCPDCVTCCSVSSCGCTIPQTIHATLTYTGNCSCIGTFVITMAYNSVTGHWDGSAPFGSCGHTIILSLRCAGVGPTGFLLNISFNDSCLVAGDAAPDNTSTCTPLNLLFSFLPRTGCGCGDNAAGCPITITA